MNYTVKIDYSNKKEIQVKKIKDNQIVTLDDDEYSKTKKLTQDTKILQ